MGDPHSNVQETDLCLYTSVEKGTFHTESVTVLTGTSEGEGQGELPLNDQ